MFVFRGRQGELIKIIWWDGQKYAGLLPTEMKRLKQLEDENGRLKKIVADLTLDREMLQDVIYAAKQTPGAIRRLVLTCYDRNFTLIPWIKFHGY